MKIIQSDVCIIGGGLTGLTLAYLLRDKNITVNIIEARERLGGRIHTKYGPQNEALELGATWLGKQHTFLISLLKELGIGIFEQKFGPIAIYEPISTSPPQLVSLPPNSDPSFRIQGGTSVLIHTLAKTLNPQEIHNNQVVKTIKQNKDGISVLSDAYHFKSEIVISTLPPYLLGQTISLTPSLPSSFLNIVQQTHTWMGESIKIGLTYKTPFWRAKNTSGTIFSSVGPIPEMYDHSNYEESAFSIKGFLNGSYFSVSKEERLALVLKQLRKYYGSQVENYLSYDEAVWRKEAYTFAPYTDHILPHQNNGHAVYQTPYWDGKLFIAGAETAIQNPGYMEGAVRSAYSVFERMAL